MKKEFFGFLFISLLIYNRGLAQDTINWRPNYKLNWEDFKAKPDSLSEFGAETRAGIRYELSFSDKSFTYNIYCYFVKKTSWVRVKSDYGLIHEQGHFNIAELFARKLKKKFKDYKFNYTTINKDLLAIFEQNNAERKKMDILYDKETDFSRKHKEQKLWNEKINNDLLKLESYK